ncbi:MAG: PAC2 family protein [archaeon]
MAAPTSKPNPNPTLGLPHMSMKVELWEKVKPNPIIIEGFPGFGFVATIATEYLMDHLKMRPIGKIWSPELAPMALVHGRRIIQPLEIFYSEKFNIVLLEAVAGVNGLEWEVADALVALCRELKAKELIAIEGIGSQMERDEPMAFYHTNQEAKIKVLEGANCKPIAEGIIFGVSGALLVKIPKDIKVSFVFAETHSNLPDSKAAAKIIEVLDKYLNLKVDYKPLLKRASDFEDKLKGIIEKAKEASDIKRSKDPETSYFG